MTRSVDLGVDIDTDGFGWASLGRPTLAARATRKLPSGGKTESACAYGWCHTDQTGLAVERHAWSKPGCRPT
jgi:hypothetical protein